MTGFIERDDTGTRIYGVNFEALTFYDDSRVKKASIYLLSDGTLNISDSSVPGFPDPPDPGAGSFVPITGGRMTGKLTIDFSNSPTQLTGHIELIGGSVGGNRDAGNYPAIRLTNAAAQTYELATSIADPENPTPDFVVVGPNNQNAIHMNSGGGLVTIGSSTSQAKLRWRGRYTTNADLPGAPPAFTTEMVMQAHPSDGYRARIRQSDSTGASLYECAIPMRLATGNDDASPSTTAMRDQANVFTANQTIRNSAPELVITDTDAPTRSLAIAMDGTVANIREDAGASGSLIALDLQNNRVSIGSASFSARLALVGNNLGDDVLSVSTPATNDDPTITISQGQQTTTNATTNSVQLIAITASRTYHIHTFVTARRTGGSSGTADDGGSFELIGTFKTASGTVTQIGATTTVHAATDGGYTVAFDISGTNVRIRITGAATTNVTWHSTTIVKSVGT